MATRCFESTRQRCLLQPPSGKGGKKGTNVTNGWRSCREWVCPERCPDASLIDGKKGGIDSWRATDSRFVNVSYVGDGVEWRD